MRAAAPARRAGSDASGSSCSTRPGAAPRKRSPPTTGELIQRLHDKVGHDAALSLTEHLSAGRSLCRLRDRIVDGDRPAPKEAIRLLAAGISLYRRYAVGDCGGGDDAATGPTDEALQQQMADDSRALVRGSATRLFALLCALECDRRLAQLERGLQALDVDKESREAVAAVGFASLWDAVRDPPARKKRRDGEEGEPEEARGHGGAGPAPEEEEATRAGWKAAIERATSGDVARHALRIGAGCLEDESWQALDGIMPLFFRHSAFSMAESLLMPEGDADYTSLTAASLLASMTQAQREKKLLAVAQAGESEAGQSVTRDMMLSFLLPSAHVGVRRTLLLTRAASTKAGVDHPTIVSRGHDVACAAHSPPRAPRCAPRCALIVCLPMRTRRMAGTEWIWTHGTDPLERMCCLLAGVAVLTTKGDEDPIRKADAFGGRVQLPCFETAPPPGLSDVRVALVPHARRWILYHLSARGAPVVLLSQRGFEGLCNAVLQLVASLR